MDRFWNKVNKTSFCWLWTGAKNNYGYGQFNSGGKTVKAHRLAYELIRGTIPTGMTLDHLCRNRACVNPDHLDPATHKTNILRGTAPAAINANKLYCKHGHKFTPENTYMVPRGRRCRICTLKGVAERKKRLKQAKEDSQ